MPVTWLSTPIPSIPFMYTFTGKLSALPVSHCTANNLLPKLVFSCVAIGHWRLWIIIRLLSSIYPKTSSPGIGLQQSAMM